MSDIRIKNTGDIFFQVEPTLAALFCATGLAEKYVPPAPEPAKPKWYVGTDRFGDKALLWLVTPLGERVPFNGDPDNAENFYSRGYRHCLPIPRDVLELFRARTPLSPAQAEAVGEARRNELEKQQAAQREQNNGPRWQYPSNM
jgi:hypothetical protein